MEFNLSNGSCIIDEDILEYVNKWKWTLGTHGYAKRCVYNGRKDGTQKVREVLLHRFVWEYHHGQIEPGLQIDHINQNKLDNRLENLRKVTKLENLANVKRSNSTGFKYVYYEEVSKNGSNSCKRNKPYRARVKVNGKRVSLGWFETALEAHRKVEEYLYSIKQEVQPKPVVQ